MLQNWIIRLIGLTGLCTYTVLFLVIVGHDFSVIKIVLWWVALIPTSAVFVLLIGRVRGDI